MSNVNFGPSQGDITAFQSVMMLSQEYTQVAKNPALADQANEMRDLRVKIDTLEKRLREAGSLPGGSGPHPPLKDGS